MPKGPKIASLKGGKVMNDLTLDGTDTSQYSDIIATSKASTFSIHVVWTATAGTLNATMALWHSNIPNPDEDDDTDWVLASDVTFTAVTGTDAKELAVVGNANAGIYRLKASRSSGSGSVAAYVVIKDYY